MRSPPTRAAWSLSPPAPPACICRRSAVLCSGLGRTGGRIQTAGFVLEHWQPSALRPPTGEEQAFRLGRSAGREVRHREDVSHHAGTAAPDNGDEDYSGAHGVNTRRTSRRLSLYRKIVLRLRSHLCRIPDVEDSRPYAALGATLQTRRFLFGNGKVHTHLQNRRAGLPPYGRSSCRAEGGQGLILLLASPGSRTAPCDIASRALRANS